MKATQRFAIDRLPGIDERGTRFDDEPASVVRPRYILDIEIAAPDLSPYEINDDET